MFSCSKNAFSFSGFGDIVTNKRDVGSSRAFSSIGTLQFKESNPRDLFLGRTVDVRDRKSLTNLNVQPPKLDPVYAQSSGIIGKSMRWWEKSLQPNMIEINSAQEFVDNLSNAGDRLVIVDFYSPGCGGCRTLHPKICQIAETNPNAVFLKVNYEELKAMCYALHVHVLPFFRFYKGAEGRVCSFSCTNATIKKFKDASAKHATDRCTVGSSKGLEESELQALASLGLISRKFMPSSNKEDQIADFVLKENKKSNALSRDDEDKIIGVNQGSGMIMA